MLVLPDRDGTMHEWAMPMEMLAGGGEEYRRRLLSMGLEIAPGFLDGHVSRDDIHDAEPVFYLVNGAHGVLHLFFLPDSPVWTKNHAS